LRALLIQVVSDIGELQAINDVVEARSASQAQAIGAASQLQAIGAEEARAAFWHRLCCDLRAIVHAICLRAAATPQGQDALQQLSWGELKSRTLLRFACKSALMEVAVLHR